jgi:hypothetical protein
VFGHFYPALRRWKAGTPASREAKIILLGQSGPFDFRLLPSLTATKHGLHDACEPTMETPLSWAAPLHGFRPRSGIQPCRLPAVRPQAEPTQMREITKDSLLCPLQSPTSLALTSPWGAAMGGKRSRPRSIRTPPLAGGIQNSKFKILRREIYMNLWVLTGQVDQK